MACPSRQRDNIPENMYSVIDLEALTAIESEYQETEDRTRSPTSSAPSSRPASRGRGGDRHQTRQQKRREQNKAAQRSFRARKEQHLSELIARIDSLELRKKVIEEENQQLMHELLRKRAENNLLRSRRPSSSWDRPLTARANLSRPVTATRTPTGGGAGGDDSGGGGSGGGGSSAGDNDTIVGHSSTRNLSSLTAKAAGKRPIRDFPGAAEQQQQQLTPRRTRTLPVETLMWLYGPFLDVWNLIREQPAVARGDVEMDDVVDRLKEMARYEDNAAAARAANADDSADSQMLVGEGSGGSGDGGASGAAAAAGGYTQMSLASSAAAGVASRPGRARGRSL